jgi:hypothetical protein
MGLAGPRIVTGCDGVKSRIKQILLKGHGDLKLRIHRQVLVSRSDTDETGRVRLSVR